MKKKMKKFEIRQTVIEISIIEAVDDETALEIFYQGKHKVKIGSVKGGDDIHIEEIVK